MFSNTQVKPILTILTRRTVYLLALLFATLLMANGQTQMTPLDKAFEAATKNPDKQSEYYNLFLNSEIFIPTHDLPSKESIARAGEGERISPFIIESEGKKYLMLFDTKERLSSWAKREVGFAVVRGHVVVEMMSADIQWALNVGTDHAKIFVSDEIKWMKENAARVAQVKVAKGTTVRVGAPANIPKGLVEALRKTLLQNTEVIEAYLAQVLYVQEGEKPHLALVLRIDASQASTAEAIRKELATASRAFLDENEFIDIFVDEGGGIAVDVIKAVGPFYVRKPAR